MNEKPHKKKSYRYYAENFGTLGGPKPPRQERVEDSASAGGLFGGDKPTFNEW